jgi:acyl-coenzyme A synthetase/AMP-(fatty) acid ligase
MSYQILHAAACRHPDHTAVVYHDTPISYAQMANAIDATMQVLERYQLADGEPVGVVIQHLLDSWVVVLALQALGAPTVCARSTEVIDALGFAANIALVTTEPDVARGAVGTFSDRRGAVICIPAPSLREDIADVVPASRSDAKFADHIVYTSGTTGDYKRVLWGGNLQQQRNAEHFDLRRYRGGAATVHHGSDFGLWTGAGYRIPLRIWQLGGCVIFDQRPQWCEYFLRPSVTHATLTPDKAHQLLEFLRSKNVAAPRDNLELMVTGGFMSQAVAEELLRRVTRNLVYAYGSTEINVLVMEATVGDLADLQWLMPLPQRAVEIVDESGTPCPVDVAGHLRIRPGELDCSHYLDAPHSNAKVFRQGWYHPGDMAVRRSDGRIRILGRSEDVINIRGQKQPVAPLELDIQQRLAVGGVCLFSGVGETGKEVVAIALEAEQWPEKAMLNSIAASLKQFEQVQFALFRRFPRTLNGMSKIDRVTLRKQVFPGESGFAAS